MIIQKNKGINLIEILIFISIIGIITAIVVPNLSQFHKQQVLKNTAEDVISLLNEARNSTISSKNSTKYGVHFETDKAILFAGDTYIPSSSNKQIDFDSSVLIPEEGGINLNNSGADITFTRITGDTGENEYGNIVIELKSDATKQKTITVNQIGIISSN